MNLKSTGPVSQGERRLKSAYSKTPLRLFCRASHKESKNSGHAKMESDFDSRTCYRRLRRERAAACRLND
jgi:hypothetical protein